MPAKRLFDNPAREAAAVWAALFVSLAVAKVSIGLIPSVGPSIVGAIAVALFLLAPQEMNRKAGRPDEDYGLHHAPWKKDVLFAVVVMAIVFPVFVVGFRGFLWLTNELAATKLGPYASPYGIVGTVRWRAPDHLLDKVAGNIAVALSEEYFYRGYMLHRFSERWPPTRRLWGAPFGKALVLQTALFAAGHLLTPAVFRLGTFFPGLLFSWMAARTERIIPSAIVHASSNLLIATLEASAFGP